MKAFKSRASSRPSPEDALAATAQAAPQQPPAAVAEQDHPATLNLRFRVSSIRALAAVAKAKGMTQKQVISHALHAAGVAVAAADLEDRTPRRQL